MEKKYGVSYIKVHKNMKKNCTNKIGCAILDTNLTKMDSRYKGRA